MKKIASLAVLLLTLLNVQAADPNEKVANSFKHMFPMVQEVKWVEQQDCFDAFFMKDNLSCYVCFDKEGKLLYSRRLVPATQLSPFLLAAIEQAYPGKSIYMITEISGGAALHYYLILQDDKRWYQFTIDSSGYISERKKYIKA